MFEPVRGQPDFPALEAAVAARWRERGTYRQSLDYVRKYCPFLTAREKDLILGDTCAAFYGLV